MWCSRLFLFLWLLITFFFRACVCLLTMDPLHVTAGMGARVFFCVTAGLLRSWSLAHTCVNGDVSVSDCQCTTNHLSAAGFVAVGHACLIRACLPSFSHCFYGSCQFANVLANFFSLCERDLPICQVF
jgi:hypothetical protein